jgi:hypothetical protein
MATIKDLDDLMTRLARASAGLNLLEYKTLVLSEMRREFGRDKLYIPPLDSRQDQARRETISAAAKHLPTGVVAERFGVSRSWVHRIVKK